MSDNAARALIRQKTQEFIPFICHHARSEFMSLDMRHALLSFAACIAIALTGCPDNTSAPGTKTADEHSHDHEGHDHAHDHSHAGPHGGKVIEIGNEEYHAEWTHDDSGKVTVYILDASMKNDVPLESDTININVKFGDDAKQYTLEAESPMSSKFSIEDKTLVGNLEALSDAVTATLSLDIKGKHYEAPITAGGHDHAHDHDHDHAHGDEHKH